MYTRCPQWRNYFRSVTVHNTFFIEGREPGDLLKGLFVLPVTEQPECRPHRNVYIRDGMVVITDRWEIQKTTQGMSCWNFTCASDIALQRCAQGWIFMRDGVPLVRMKSELDFERYEGWVSSAYGVKKSAHGLRARTELSPAEHTIYFVPASPCL